ncbi:DUF1513 domain-containing protein [uncultured Psychrobacter sp.]|uniref:DUF1513 domain-containing protein n=1 Tax=uncultured Psychrobacter sp. TaxID=259303 RepID=UPI00345B2A6E
MAKNLELTVLKKTLRVVFGTVFGTSALVGIHHRYRKLKDADASVQDYKRGLESQLKSLPLKRLQFAYQQALRSGQQAYLNYPQVNVNVQNNNEYKNNSEDKIATSLTALHTTTMLARPICWVSGVASMPHNISLIDDDSESGFGVVGIDADKQLVWQTTMPERVHDIVVQPIANNDDKGAISNISTNTSNSINHNLSRDVVVMGRRPSESFWVLDTATGQVQYAIKAAHKRHFYGHACYSLDGSKLYVTENDTVNLIGKIGIYDTQNHYQKIAEFDSHGIGPHELIMHPDGDTLVIANGGIKTEQASREELNLDTMQPSLVYLNRHNGALLQQVMPEHNQMSIRHLAMHDNGTVMIGIQFQGDKHINVPLVLTHKRGDANFTPLKMPNNQWQRFHQYIASVAVDSQNNLLCVTTPIGGCAAIYDLDTLALIDSVSLPDCAGASILKNNIKDNDINPNQSGFVISDGQGQLTTLISDSPLAQKTNVMNNSKQIERIIKDSYTHKMSFDNHLQAL